MQYRSAGQVSTYFSVNGGSSSGGGGYAYQGVEPGGGGSGTSCSATAYNSAKGQVVVRH